MFFGSFFTFSNFYQLLLHNKSLVALTNLWLKISKNRIENQTSHALVMVVKSACLLIFEVDTWVLPLVFTIESRVVIKIWRSRPISFKHVPSWCLLLWSLPNHAHTPSVPKWLSYPLDSLSHNIWAKTRGGRTIMGRREHQSYLGVRLRKATHNTSIP